MINKDDIEQITKMYQWAATEKSIATFSLFQANQENGEQRYGIRCYEWINNKWSTTVGGGVRVVDAMQDFSERRAAKYEK